MRVITKVLDLKFLPFCFSFFIFFRFVFFSLASEQMEAFKPEPLFFESVRAQLEQCETKADVQLRFGPPKSSVASVNDFTLYFWDWTPYCMVMDLTNVCSGFTICVSNNDDVMYTWAPSWFGSVPKDIPEIFYMNDLIPEDRSLASDKKEEVDSP